MGSNSHHSVVLVGLGVVIIFALIIGTATAITTLTDDEPTIKPIGGNISISVSSSVDEDNIATGISDNESDSNDSDSGGGPGLQLPPLGSGSSSDSSSSTNTVGSAPSDVTVLESESGIVTTTEPVVFRQTAVKSLEFDDPDPTWSVTVRDFDTEPSANGPAPGETLSVSQVSISDEATDESATIRIAVDPAQRTDKRPDNLRIMVATDDGWTQLETAVVKDGTEDGAAVLLEADTPKVGRFVVSDVGQPTAAVELESGTITAGDEIELSGSRSIDSNLALESFEWMVGNTTFEGETITATIDEPGEYTVWLTVTNDAGETDTTTATLTVTDDTRQASDDDLVDGSLVWAGLAAVVAAVVGGGAYWFRREQ